MSPADRSAIEASLLAWMRQPRWRDDDERFDSMALGLFALQFERCDPYRRFCQGRGRTPGSLASWRDIPPVPSGAFKELALRSFPEARTLKTFRTSGTTTAARGELHLDDLELYEASLLASFRRHVLPPAQSEAPVPARIHVLAPTPSEAPDSSLSHMFGVVVRELGDPASGFHMERGALRTDAALAALGDAVGEDRPVTLCGTAFAFVHLLDALERRGARLRLPPGSRVMETGGFKGRSREVPRHELYRAIDTRLGVAADAIVNQYGMTELGSQFYDSVLLRPGEPRRKLRPPWTRVVIVDPTTGSPSPPGSTGAIVVVDLANTGSVIAIQTADAGRRIGDDGFEVLGRAEGAEERGCSIATDELLAASAGPGREGTSRARGRRLTEDAV